MPLPKWPGYEPDEDDPTSIDDAFIRYANRLNPGDYDNCVHIERMSPRCYWLGVTVDGVTTHVDIFIDHGRLKARVRR